MKKILDWTYVWILSLIVVGVSGCSDDDKSSPLAEPVPLKMSLNTTDLVMDETLEVTFEVTGTEEGKTMMNEDLSIKLSATTNRGAVEHLLFEGFPSEVIMKQGEKKKTVFIPVKKEGINKEYYVDISAFARGYRMAGAMQNIVVSAYHNSEVSLKNNIDKTVKEGQMFTLMASVNTKVQTPLEITITPKAGEEDRYEDLPEKLIIPAGKSSVTSVPVTMTRYRGKYDIDEKLTLYLATTDDNTRYPLKSKELVINKIDLHTNFDIPEREERFLYEDADVMFVSEKNENAVKAWGQLNYKLMKEGDPHPNNEGVLPSGKWTFYRAYEFHKIPSCLKSQESNDKNFVSEEYPLGFADQNTAAVETAGAVDNAKYAWVMDEGYLRMIALQEKTTSSINGTKNFGTSAFYCNKFKRQAPQSYTYPSSNVRIYPGMRIETRARIRGTENSGMLPGIWLQGNEQVGGNSDWYNWPDFGEIDVMENNSKSSAGYKQSVEQTFHIGNIVPGEASSGKVPHWNPTQASEALKGTINRFNIYWMEWIDDHTVSMGINGKETIRISDISSADGARLMPSGHRWPFSYNINDEGLYYILTMMFLGKVEPDYPPMKMTYQQARRILSSDPNDTKIPRMEIDWVRFYIDQATYNDHKADGKTYNEIILY